MGIRKKYLTKKNYKIAETLVAVAISYAASELLKAAWEKASDRPAPDNPNSEEADIREVIFFSASLAAVSSALKLLARNKFSKIWSGLDGELPSELPEEPK